MPPLSLIESETAWSLPTSSIGSRETSSRTSDFPILSGLPAAICAPLVLSVAELGLILGSSRRPSRSSHVFIQRNYLSDLYPNRNNLEKTANSSLSAFCKPQSPIETATESVFPELVNVGDLFSGAETRTTFMVRRLPRFISADQLKYLLSATGILENALDLIYVPVFTGKAHANRGYAFLNFKSPLLGALFISLLKDHVETELSTHLCRCDVVYAHIQTRELMLANLSRIRDAAWWPEPSLPPGLLLF